MKTAISIPDLENFISVLAEYGKHRNDPYLIGAAQELKTRLIDNQEGEDGVGFRECLTAFSRGIHGEDFISFHGGGTHDSPQVG